MILDRKFWSFRKNNSCSHNSTKLNRNFQRHHYFHLVRESIPHYLNDVARNPIIEHGTIEEGLSAPISFAVTLHAQWTSGKLLSVFPQELKTDLLKMSTETCFITWNADHQNNPFVRHPLIELLLSFVS